MAQGRGTSDLVKRVIEEMVREDLGISAATVERRLERRSDLGDIPGKSTIQKYVKQSKEKHAGAAWPGVRLDSDPSRDTAALDVLAYVTTATLGRIADVTEEESQWFRHLRAVRPDLPDRATWLLAWQYISRTKDAEDTRDLDMYLALAPWRGDEEEDAYHVILERLNLTNPTETRTFDVVDSETGKPATLVLSLDLDVLNRAQRTRRSRRKSDDDAEQTREQ